MLVGNVAHDLSRSMTFWQCSVGVHTMNTKMIAMQDGLTFQGNLTMQFGRACSVSRN